jgi:hypothetical protein
VFGSSATMRTAQTSSFSYFPASPPCVNQFVLCPFSYVLKTSRPSHPATALPPPGNDSRFHRLLVPTRPYGVPAGSSAPPEPSFGSHGIVGGSSCPCTRRHGTTARGHASL